MKTNFCLFVLLLIKYVKVESSKPDPHGDSKVCNKHKCQRKVAKGLLMGHFSGKVIPDHVIVTKTTGTYLKNENECLKSCVRTEDCAAVNIGPPVANTTVVECTIAAEADLTLDQPTPLDQPSPPGTKLIEKKTGWKIILNGVNKCIESLVNPCKNGGECKRSGKDLKSYTCTCPKDGPYSGINCEVKAPNSYEIRYNDYDTGARNLTSPDTRWPVTFVKDAPGYKLIELAAYANRWQGSGAFLFSFWSHQQDLTATTWLKFTDISDLIENKKSINLFNCQRWGFSFDPSVTPAVMRWTIFYTGRQGHCCPQRWSGPASFNLECQVENWKMWNQFAFTFDKNVSVGGAQIWLNGKTCGSFVKFSTYGAGNKIDNTQYKLYFLREEPKVGVLTTGIRLYHEYFSSTKIEDTYNLERKEFFNL